MFFLNHPDKAAYQLVSKATKYSSPDATAQRLVAVSFHCYHRSSKTMNTIVTVPRHARILPSFAVRFIGKSLKCSIGTINKNDLLAWSGTLPSAYTSQEIRKQFVAGRRSTFEKLWEAPIEVGFSESWESVLGDTERVRMRGLLEGLKSSEALPTLTLREAKAALRLPVEAVLGLLAKLEAIYWSPSMARVGSFSTSVQRIATTTQEVSDSWRQEVRIALSSNWIQTLDPNDIRFPSASSQSLADWVQVQLLEPALPTSTIELCNTLVAADKYDWRTELQALAKASLNLSLKRPRDAEAAERWEKMLVSRFGGVEGRTLQQVGDMFSVTRERVRQICD